jgi:hypothetical protein
VVLVKSTSPNKDSMLYERPYYYAISHIVIGFIAAWYSIIGVLAILYQAIQYVLDVRFFPVTMMIKKGNSIAHTGLKLVEIGMGYVIGYTVQQSWPLIKKESRRAS